MSVPRSRLIIVGIALAYVISLRFSYSELISPAYSYLAYTFRRPPLAAEVVAWVFAVLPSVWLPLRLTRPSQAVYWLLYLLVIVPAQLIPLYSLSRPPEQVLLIGGLILLGFGLMGCAYRIPLLRLPAVDVKPLHFGIGLGLAAVILYGIVAIVFGFRFGVVGLEDHYELRGEFKEAVSGGGRFAVYAFSWLAMVLNPTAMAVGLARRRYWLFAVGAGGQLALFFVGGHKSVLLSAVLAFGLWLSVRDEGAAFGRRVALAGLLLVLVTVGLDLAIDTPGLSSVFVRRMIVTPGLLTGYYFDHFADLPVLGILGQTGGEQSTATVIGEEYFSRVSMNANANMWADGFARLGYLGVLLVSAVAALIFWVIDSVSDGKNLECIVVMVGITGRSLCDSALPTTMMTHGLIWCGLLIWLLPFFEEGPSLPAEATG